MTKTEIYNMYPEESFVTADGFDDAILGIVVTKKTKRILYSVPACIDILIAMGMTEEEAYEYFDFNTRGAYVGEQTPVWLDDARAAEWV